MEKAAQVASPEQIARLARIIKVEERSEVDISEVVAANDSFHLGIAELAGNQLVFDQNRRRHRSKPGPRPVDRLRLAEAGAKLVLVARNSAAVADIADRDAVAAGRL